MHKDIKTFWIVCLFQLLFMSENNNNLSHQTVTHLMVYSTSVDSIEHANTHSLIKVYFGN